MKSSTKNAGKSVREIAYYRQRYQNRFFAKLVSFITEEAQRNKITKKDMAEKLGKDPAQLSRLLSHPSNLTLDTVSDLLLALDAEAEPPEIVRFSERRQPNYIHPLIARVVGAQAKTSALDVMGPKSTQTKGSGGAPVRVPILGSQVAAEQ
jgi:hypothetical protein